MYNSINEQEDKNLLSKWFLKDDNILPPTYVLQPITDLLPDYGNVSVTKDARSNASKEWWTAFERMQVVFRNAADKIFKESQKTRWKYFMSGINKIQIIY